MGTYSRQPGRATGGIIRAPDLANQVRPVDLTRSGACVIPPVALPYYLLNVPNIYPQVYW